MTNGNGWRQALALLERGERARAEAVLETASDVDPEDRWVRALLRASLMHATLRDEELRPPTTEIGGSAPPDEREGQADSALDAATVGFVLAEGLRAARAVGEGRVDDAARHTRAAADRTPTSGLWLRIRAAALFQAVFRFSGRAEHHDRAVAIAAAVADRVEAPHMAVTARGVVGTVHLVSGHFHACLERCTSAIELAAACGLGEDPAVALAHQFRGYVLYEWNRLGEARCELERAWELSAPDARGVRSGVTRMLAAVAAAQGRHDEARMWIERLEDIVSEPMTLRNREWLAAVRALHATGEGPDLRSIDAWRRSFDYDPAFLAALTDGEASAKLHEHEHLLTLLEATSQWEAMGIVAGVLARGAGELRRWFAVRALAAEAVALEATGRHDRADSAWLEALRRGELGGYVRAYVDGSPIRRSLLRRSLERDESRPYARRVVECCPDLAGGLDRDRLTPRQRDALRLVAEGLTNRQIARAMGVGETTVRTHLREVFARLQARSRTQAVAEARRLGLLD